MQTDLAVGAIDLDTDTTKVALVTSSYTPIFDSYDNFDDVTNEVSGTSYTAGGQALVNKIVSAVNTDDEGVFDAEDLTLASLTITSGGAVLYMDTSTPSTSKLIKYPNFGSDIVPVDELARHIDDLSH